MRNSKPSRMAVASPWSAAVIAGGIGLWLGRPVFGQIVEPPGYILYYAGPSGTPDGDLDNPNEWFQVETDYPNNAPPGGSDAASVSVPGLGEVYGSLDCWGAGLTANDSSLLIQASVSTGAGGLAISGDPYSTGEATLELPASTSGIFDTNYRVNLNASVDVGQYTYVENGVQRVNYTNVNDSLTTNGLNVESGATLNIASGATVTTGQVGSLPTNFYSTTTALQIDGATVVSLNGGTLTSNGDTVIGTVPADSSQSYYAQLNVTDGGALTTAGATYLGVNNANTAEGAAGPGSGLMIVTGAHSLWEAQADINVGASNGGFGSIFVEDGGTLKLDANVNLRLGSEFGGFGYITFDATGGKVTLDSDSSSSIIVGDQFQGGMTVQNGASITHAGTLVIGNADGSGGQLTVDGTGSALTVGGNISVGVDGTGAISLTNGGSLTAQSVTSAGASPQTLRSSPVASAAQASGFVVSLGTAATGNGTLTIDGTGSAMNIDGDLAVGDAGTGSLTVSGNATLTNQSATVGNQANSTGTVLVTDIGSLWHSYGDLTVGGSGTGSVTVQSGGTLQLAGDLTLGKEQNANGTITLDGSDSRLTFGSGELTVGSSGTGTLTVQNGFLADLSGNEVTVGDESGGSGTLTVTDANTTLNTGNLTVGSSGTGTLSVQDGAVLHTTIDATVGDESGGKGTATVDSATWNIDGSLTLGSTGTGELDIDADGTVAVSGSAITLGENSGGKGTLVLNGDGADITFTGKTTVGDGGSGTLTVKGGASVTLGDLTFGEQQTASGTLTVDGTGAASTLHVAGDLTLAEQGSASASITNGGNLNVDGDFKIPHDAKGGKAVSATVDLASAVNVGGGLTVGSQAAGTLTLNHGSTLAVDGETVLGEMDGGAGTLTVENAGSNVSSTFTYGGAITVGKGGAGTLAISNGGRVQPAAGSEALVTLAADADSSGKVTVDGAGSQLLANQVVVGGASGGTGSITLTNGGAVQVASQLLLWKQAKLSVTGGSFTVGASIPVAAEGTLQVNPGGTLAGFGAISGTVIDAGGIIEPGGDPGTLEIDGDFQQLAGTLDLGIDGSDPAEYNQLLVLGDVTLDGTVLLDFQDGFAPSAGEQFDLIAANGPFTLSPDQVQVNGLQPGWQYQIDLSGDGLTIDSLSNAAPVPEPASALFVSVALPLLIPRRRRRSLASRRPRT